MSRSTKEDVFLLTVIIQDSHLVSRTKWNIIYGCIVQIGRERTVKRIGTDIQTGTHVFGNAIHIAYQLDCQVASSQKIVSYIKAITG